MTKQRGAAEGVKRGPSPEQVQAIVRVVRSGCSASLAAAAAGVPESLLTAWLALGEAALEGEPLPKKQSTARQSCVELVLATRREAALAEADCMEAVWRVAVDGESIEETTTVTDNKEAGKKETRTIKKHPPQWKAAQWWLEQRQRLQASSADPAPVAPVINYALDPAAMDEEGHRE